MLVDDRWNDLDPWGQIWYGVLDENNKSIHLLCLHGGERAFAGLGARVYEMMWGPTEFEPVTGMLKGWDVTERLGEIRVPTLLTVGEFDECPIELAEDMSGRIPEAELAVFAEGSQHHFYEERARYMDVVLRFLHRVEG